MRREMEVYDQRQMVGGPPGQRRANDASVVDEDGAAQTLNATDLETDECDRVFNAVMRNVELMLACDVIHADLSAFNVLYRDGEVRIIDFPQAVDPRFNSSALSLLDRDVYRGGAIVVEAEHGRARSRHARKAAAEGLLQQAERLVDGGREGARRRFEIVAGR